MTGEVRLRLRILKAAKYLLSFFLSDDLWGAVCLFCPVNYPDITELVEHMNLIHGFDFVKLKQDLNLNFYQQVEQNHPCVDN